ncbi:MAG: methylated-DNA--[protein]-cysteine S-methyltransferase, partial [Candidatus Hydrogenedentota bacterium]
ETGRAARSFHVAGPVGDLTVDVSSHGLKRIVLLPERAQAEAEVSQPDDPLLRAIYAELHRYFAGTPVDFAEIPLDLEGHTAFRRAVWDAARRVPWGETESYGGLSRALGRSNRAAVAVGQALAANPIPIVIPCHRILGADRKLTGFSGGLEWKRRLLALEGIRVAG